MVADMITESSPFELLSPESVVPDFAGVGSEDDEMKYRIKTPY